MAYIDVRNKKKKLMIVLKNKFTYPMPCMHSLTDPLITHAHAHAHTHTHAYAKVDKVPSFVSVPFMSLSAMHANQISIKETSTRSANERCEMIIALVHMPCTHPK